MTEAQIHWYLSHKEANSFRWGKWRESIW